MLARFAWLFALVAVLSATSNTAFAELQRYGSIYVSRDLAKTGFLLGPIQPNDSFELRRVIRDHQIELIVTGSPGGNLYEGLQMASIIRDNNIGTYLPLGWSCESSCANVFFGGQGRMALGELGVHQFYSPGQDNQNATLGQATEQTLYATSDIIGILNGFDTPAFVYERMFGTTEIYYFSEGEKRDLGLGANSSNYLARIASADSFIARQGRTLLDIRQRQFGGEQRIAEQITAPAPRPQPTAPPATDQDIFRNMDFFGSDLSPTGYRHVSIEECDDICRSNPNCAAWSYVHGSRWCWPKSGVSNISLAEDVTSAVVDYSRVDPTIFDRPFIETTGRDIRGYDIFPQGLRNTSLSQCRAICERNTACRGFSWVVDKNWCFPKYQVGPTVAQIGIISGVLSPN